MKLMLAITLSVAAAACATTPAPQNGEPPIAPPPAQCDASNVQDQIGKVATAQLGAMLLDATGATVLRWMPPRTAMTMDYRIERLTVSYDDNMLIERISCG